MALNLRTINGTEQSDTLTGGDDDELIIGGGGNDWLFGGRGNDVLNGGAGNDTLNGGEGNDKLNGGDGSDTLLGSIGADLNNGGEGSDTVDYHSSNAGVQVDLRNGTGRGGHAEGDTYTSIENVRGSAYSDSIVGSDAANTLDGEGGDDKLFGGKGNDIVRGGSGNDSLFGEDGDDWLDGGAGADRLDGGVGVDSVRYQSSNKGVYVNLAEGKGRDGHADGDTYAGIEDVEGSRFDDRIIGDTFDNRLFGSDGNDVIDGGEGNDTLLGGLGNDTLIAGSGNNVLGGGTGIDTVDYSAHASGLWIALGGSNPSGDGAVLEFSGDLYEVLANPDAPPKDTLSWIENVNGTAHADVILGSDAANTLLGNGGDDIIHGGNGDDTEKGGAGNDTLGTWVLGFGPIVGYFDDTGNDSLYGGEGDDTLVGSSGADRMDGGDDIDTVDYTWSPDAVTVNLVAGIGGGSATSWSNGDTFFSIEKVVGSNHADWLAGSTGNETIDGGELDDQIFGLSGNDVLLGGYGGDTIQGGDDDDEMTGGEGNDTFVFFTEPNAILLSPERGDGHDVIHDFELLSDRIAIVGSNRADLTFRQDGANTVIGYDDGNSTITLENVTVNDLMSNLSSAIVFA